MNLERKKTIIIKKDILDNYKEIENKYDNLIEANDIKIKKYDYQDRVIYERMES